MKFSILLLVILILVDAKPTQKKRKKSASISSLEIDSDVLEELLSETGAGLLDRQLLRDIVWDLAGRKTLITIDMLTEEYLTFRMFPDKETNIPLIKDPESNKLYVVKWSIISSDIDIFPLYRGPKGEYIVYDDNNETMLVSLNKYNEVELQPYVNVNENELQVVKI